MHALTSLSLALLATANAIAVPTPKKYEEEPQFAGYLITTFSDPNPQIQMHLSQGNDATKFTALNGGQEVLQATVGTKGVRDPFLISDGERKEWYIIATGKSIMVQAKPTLVTNKVTDLDIRVDGFNWDKATRTGSLGLVVWKSSNLVDWSEPELVTVESPQGGMAWAPSAVWDEETSQFNVFWASRLYAENDTEHTGEAITLDTIRFSTTKDFSTFAPAQDYLALPDTPIIDQEFQYLGKAGHYARYIKNETNLKVWQETTTEGIFGTWTRNGDYVVPDSPVEGAASCADNLDPDLYHLLLDDYNQYNPFETRDIQSGTFERSDYPSYPSGLKHGCVTQLTQAEYDAIKVKYDV